MPYTCTWLTVPNVNKFLHISSSVAAMKKGEKKPTIYSLPTSSHSSRLHGVCSPPQLSIFESSPSTLNLAAKPTGSEHWHGFLNKVTTRLLYKGHATDYSSTKRCLQQQKLPLSKLNSAPSSLYTVQTNTLSQEHFIHFIFLKCTQSRLSNCFLLSVFTSCKHLITKVNNLTAIQT